jgi:hypothetical protein
LTLKHVLLALFCISSPLSGALEPLVITENTTMQELLEYRAEQAAEGFDRVFDRIKVVAPMVDANTYRDAIKQRRFKGGIFTTEQAVQIAMSPEECPMGVNAGVVHKDGVAHIYGCPWYALNDEEKQIQTFYQEFVHVIAGQGECRAMAYSYWIDYLDKGSYHFEEPIWNQHGCDTQNYPRPPRK